MILAVPSILVRALILVVVVIVLGIVLVLASGIDVVVYRYVIAVSNLPSSSRKPLPPSS